MPKFLQIREGWLTVGLLAILLFSVTLSIQQARWSEGLGMLTPITLIGLFTGLILAKARGVPRFLLDLVGLGVGAVTVLVAVASVMQDPRLGSIQERVQDLIARTANWVNIAIRQDMSDDLIVFIFSLAVVTWVLAYSSAYFVFRARQLWWALVPNGVALLINLSYSTVNLHWYIIIFAISALLLMIRFNLLVREERWQQEGVLYSPRLSWNLLWAGSSVAGVLALAMWFVPSQSVNSTLYGMWEKVNGPWLDFQSNMSKLWSQVPGNQSIGGYSSFNDSFLMGGSLNLSDATAMYVESKEARYWRAASYDEYTGYGWRNTAPKTFDIDGLSSRLALDSNQVLFSDDDMRRELTITVEMINPKGDMIFTSLRPHRLDRESRLEISWQEINEVYNLDNLYQVYSADNVEPVKADANLDRVPLELRKLVGLLRESQNYLRGEIVNALANGTSPQEIEGYSRIDLLYGTPQLEDIRRQVTELERRNVSVEPDVMPGIVFEPDGSIDPKKQVQVDLRVIGKFPVYNDISAIHARQPVGRNGKYSVVSLVTDATEDQLRAASTDYERWLLNRYLGLPELVPARVRLLAETVVSEAGATNPYDQAKAIEKHLRDNYAYSTTIDQPPAGRDRTDWFLFEGKEGYCEYYSTSMVVMLRHLGIPSRVATGYAPGSYDVTLQKYVVKESAAHAWVEAYFPGYGWIEFEPTPSQVVIPRDPITDPDLGELTPTPVVEATPTVRTDDGQSDPVNIPTPAPTSGTGGSGGDIGWLTLGGLAAVGLGGLWFFRRRMVADRADTGHYYGRMMQWARLLKVRPLQHQTPYEFTETLAREVPGAAPLARQITRAYVRSRYARPSDDPAQKAALGKTWENLRSRIIRSVPRGTVRRVRRSR